ncbi:hypothetical protein NC00_07610 [Xanthomonas cannabis pv. phaseoli]|uniref:Uncharacterized protein n=1 Tax=Xanthomonas cannabis pv. phaseoli TaxID=1885902 RepID=A0AB34P9W6_9XANT|nr:hypothetical protein NC00_07610 [Xanthomonas cannabis pv. phaseoli]
MVNQRHQAMPAHPGRRTHPAGHDSRSRAPRNASAGHTRLRLNCVIAPQARPASARQLPA